MRLKRYQLLATALSAAALLVPLDAGASRGDVPAANTAFHGAGQGKVNTLPPPASPGRTRSKSGTTFALGASVNSSGGALEGRAQEGQPTLGASDVTRVSEPGGTYALLLAGLAAIGFTVRRRMP